MRKHGFVAHCHPLAADVNLGEPLCLVMLCRSFFLCEEELVTDPSPQLRGGEQGNPAEAWIRAGALCGAGSYASAAVSLTCLSPLLALAFLRLGAGSAHRLVPRHRGGRSRDRGASALTGPARPALHSASLELFARWFL